ncbi:hypothetical protein HRR77_000648 [Exophiala dermatitidis]|nr:hypothetical protein HRR77_000648 [Exophiala dermatitidis]KAJ4590374.1 hypothetical protein HRR82_000733 [Exophiala dermatitidis]KAJ4621450.1 hypothetical protein HRR85_001644 [Exophiala dermatitidis]
MAAISQRDGCLFSRIKMRGNAQCYELEASIGRGERASVESSSSNAVYRSGFSNLAPRGWQLRMLVTSAHSTNQLPPFFGSIPSPVNFEVHAQPCDKPSSVSSGVACLTELHCLDGELVQCSGGCLTPWEARFMDGYGRMQPSPARAPPLERVQQTLSNAPALARTPQLR